MTDTDQKGDQPAGGDETRDISAAILFMLFLLVVNEYFLHRLILVKERFPKLVFLQGSSLTTLLGILSGILLNLTEIVDIVKIIKQGFSEFFLIVLLPPILYESAINMERKFFFKNFGSILGYAVVGTTIAIFITALLIFFIGWLGLSTDLGLNASFAFGALISATDPVAVLTIFKELNCDKNLFALIFGESILNDAISIIVYNTTVQLKGDSGDNIVWKALSNFLQVFAGSIIIGLLIGILTAYVLKNKEKSDDESQSNTELTILFLIPWVSYLIAEVLKLSGIVSIMFCGIAMARYALPNVTENGRKVNKKLYTTLAYTFENLVFIFIGIGLVSFDLAWKEMGASLFICSFLIINFARYLNIEGITYMLNKYRLKNKINKTFRFIMWFSGFRGAMAYALSMKSSEQFVDNDYGRIMLTMTLLYANINIFVHASMLVPIAQKFQIQQNFDILEDQNQNNQQDEKREEVYKGFWNRVKEICVMFDENCLQKLLLVDEQDIDKSMSNFSPKTSQKRKQQLIQGVKRSNSFEDKSQQDIEMQFKRRNSLKLSFAKNNNKLISDKKLEDQDEFEASSSHGNQINNSEDGNKYSGYLHEKKIELKLNSNVKEKPKSDTFLNQNNGSTQHNQQTHSTFIQSKKSDDQFEDHQNVGKSGSNTQIADNQKAEKNSDSPQSVNSDSNHKDNQEFKEDFKKSSCQIEDPNIVITEGDAEQVTNQLNQEYKSDNQYEIE